jgi:pimeloyl-ACP methyl ester carboxylesterase
MEAVVNGIRLYYVQVGQGTPLLLIHGYPLDHALWQPQIDGLADAARICELAVPEAFRDRVLAPPPPPPPTPSRSGEGERGRKARPISLPFR